MFELMLALTLSFSGCASSGVRSKHPVTPVTEVDLNRYQGLWYEYAMIPNSFQKECERDTTAEYQILPNGLVQVVNRCVKSNGQKQSVIGRARTLDTTNARLKVTFVRLFGKWIFAFGGDYWILALDTDYQWAFVGTPNRRFGWILSRTPELYPQEIDRIAQAIKTQGYNPCDFIRKKHTDSKQSELRPFCYH